jgi:hypothetical protein
MLRLITGDHMPSIIHLQECQLSSSLGQSGPIVPVMIFRLLEVLAIVPIELGNPRLVSKVVADKVNIAGVDEGGDVIVEQVGNVAAKIL